MNASESKGKVDFGIITIREDEFVAVLQRFSTKEGIASGRRQYNLRRVQREGGDSALVAVVRCNEQGTSEAQAVAQALLDDLAPRWVLLVGIAGGAPADEFTLGDVVVSNRICDFSVEAVVQDRGREYALLGGPVHPEAAKIATNLPASTDELGPWSSLESIGLDRPTVSLSAEALYGEPEWQARVRRTLEHHFDGTARVPRVTVGAIASSDRLMKDTELFQVWLRIARQVLAVEMEAAGVYRATHDRGVPFLTIRGISDIVGFRRAGAWTQYACHSAAAFTHAFVKAFPSDSGSPPLRPS